jgi:hypothetical protein
MFYLGGSPTCTFFNSCSCHFYGFTNTSKDNTWEPPAHLHPNDIKQYVAKLQPKESVLSKRKWASVSSSANSSPAARVQQNKEAPVKRAKAVKQQGASPSESKGTPSSSRDPTWAEVAVEQIGCEAGHVICKHPSIKEAALSSGALHGNIQKCLKGQRKTTGGFRWRKAPDGSSPPRKQFPLSNDGAEEKEKSKKIAETATCVVQLSSEQPTAQPAPLYEVGAAAAKVDIQPNTAVGILESIPAAVGAGSLVRGYCWIKAALEDVRTVEHD